MRHLMSPLDFSVEELDKLLDLANDIEKFPGKYAHACDGKKLAQFTGFDRSLLFDKLQNLVMARLLQHGESSCCFAFYATSDEISSHIQLTNVLICTIIQTY